MDLANTEIVIRERTLPQRLDLSFHLLRRFGRDITIYSLAGIAPFFILNILIAEGLDRNGYWEYYQWYGKWYLVFLLTLLEGPLAMSPLLIYLSQRIFRQKVRLWTTIQKSIRHAPRMITIYGLVRLNLLVLLLLLSLYHTDEAEMFLFFLFVAVLWNAAFFVTRPYVDSIVLLEQLRFRSPNQGKEPSIGSRSAALHRYQSGELLGEGMSLLSINFSLFVGAYGVLLWGVYLIGQNTVTANWFSWTFFAAALWLTQIFSTVFRFLGYLDTRVRLEGWELELRLKAAGQKVRASLEPFHPAALPTADRPNHPVRPTALPSPVADSAEDRS